MKIEKKTFCTYQELCKTLTSKIIHKERTLRIKPSFLYTMTIAILLSAILVFVVEFMSRSDFASANLSNPIIASGHYQFDVKLELLDQLIKKKGRVDCIFIGASVVKASIDCKQFVKEFEALTEKKIVCFNLGLPGFAPYQAADLAKIIVKKYKPALIIWGLSPGSFLKKQKNKFVFAENFWARYWLGDFNLKGWVMEHSYAYRYFQRFYVWLALPQYDRDLVEFTKNTGEFGFRTTKGDDFKSLKPDRKHIQRIVKKVRGIDKSKDSFIFLEQVLQLHSQVNIAIVEIPLHRSIVDYKKDIAVNYSKAVAYISNRVKQQGVVFISTDHLNLIPDNGWRNSNHMNPLGAEIFSLWLGKKVGRKVKEGLISIEK